MDDQKRGMHTQRSHETWAHFKCQERRWHLPHERFDEGSYVMKVLLLGKVAGMT
jgi:hypothetical protein